MSGASSPVSPTRRVWEVAALLAAATVAVYWNVHKFEFVSYDDPFFVTRNTHVLTGLSGENIAWAFQSVNAFFSPLTWMSHMLDAQLHGGWAGGHHVTNLIWHVATVVVLLWAWYRLTGLLWPSALVAALFALHPLHAESVAWVSERKGILSSFFYVATVWAYAGYARRPTVASYALVTGSLVLGLLAKPTLVTLPCVLALLDYWPLGRLRLRGSGLAPAWTAPAPPLRWYWLLAEKVPWFLIVAAFSAVAIRAEQNYGALDWLPDVTFASRAANALIVYWLYLAQFFAPVGLMFFYPHPGNDVSRGGALVAAGALLLVLGVACWQAQRRPYLLTGWLWYLGTLVPVIGLVQVGGHRMADRYTDIPLIGISVIVAWGVAEFVRRMPELVAGATAVVLLVVAVFAGITWTQAAHWRNTEALYRHAVAVDPDNWVALSNLGLWLDEQGRHDEALEIHARAIAANPNNPSAASNLASALMRSGRLAEAIEVLEPTVAKNPKSMTAQANLAIAYSRAGRNDDARRHFELALELGQDEPDVRHNYGLFLAKQGDVAGALAQFREAMRLQPGRLIDLAAVAQVLLDHHRYAEAVTAYDEILQRWPTDSTAYEGRAEAYAMQGKLPEALADYQRSLAGDRPSQWAAIGLAWIRAAAPQKELRNGTEAVRFGERACAATGNKDPEALDALAAAYAEAGRFERAQEVAERARQQARLLNDRDLAAGIESRLALYRQRNPYRGLPPARTNVPSQSGG
ncbi:MAG: tetratricopeptide repeat protein [Planctomycetaceae bacterium]|nr:tetratricopeptide repeat protein [Planctomycetaceae bacterium]